VNKCTIYCQEWRFKTWVEDLWSSSLNIKFSGLIIFGRPCIMTIHLSNTAKNLHFYDHLRIELMSLDAKHRAMSHKYSIYQKLNNNNNKNHDHFYGYPLVKICWNWHSYNFQSFTLNLTWISTNIGHWTM